MFDHETYNYVTMHLPNVMAELYKDRAYGTPVVHPYTAPFLDALVKKYPNWKFVGQVHRYSGASSSGDTNISIFKVVEGNQTIGLITAEHHYKFNQRYAVTNKRIDRLRYRGSWTYTKDLKKAIKLVSDNFSSLTTEELLEAATSNVNSKLNDITGGPRRAYDGIVRDLNPRILNYAAAHWEEVASSPIMAGISRQVLDSFPAKHAAMLEAKAFNDSYYGHNGIMSGVVVTVNNRGEYVVQDRLDKKVAMFSPQDLPEGLKTKLGMLKLSDAGVHVPDVGVKADDSTFFVSGYGLGDTNG